MTAPRKNAAAVAANPVPVKVVLLRVRDPPSTVWIGLGANLGERADTLRTALVAIAALSGTRVQRVSSLYRSAPVGAGGPDYLNAVAELRTTLALVEKSLDQFFRNPGQRAPLAEVPGQLAQMRGVFSVLGLDQASTAARRMRGWSSMPMRRGATRISRHCRTRWRGCASS